MSSVDNPRRPARKRIPPALAAAPSNCSRAVVTAAPRRSCSRTASRSTWWSNSSTPGSRDADPQARIRLPA